MTDFFILDAVQYLLGTNRSIKDYMGFRSIPENMEGQIAYRIKGDMERCPSCGVWRESWVSTIVFSDLKKGIGKSAIAPCQDPLITKGGCGCL